MNFFNPAFFLESLFVLCVLFYIGTRFVQQRATLKQLDAQLQSERAVLEATKAQILQAQNEDKTAPETFAILNNSLNADSALGKRWQLLFKQRQNQTSNLTSRRALSEAESSRVLAATDDARFWSGAFVFIGLIGTLLCLGIAVFYLMRVVGGAGNTSGMASSLKDVTRNMTGTFLSMGLAFVNTGAGAGLTVMLSGQVNRYEKAAEAFRQQLEEFSLIELEPLFAINPVATDDTARLEKVVERMETLTQAFIASLEITQQNVKTLGATTAASAEKLDGAAATFTGAADNLALNVAPLNERLSKLGLIIERHETAQSTFISNVQSTLQWLESAVKNADAAFAKLDGFREQLQKDNAVTRELHLELLERLHQQGRERDERGQKVFYEYKQESIAGIKAIEDRIREGNEREEKTVRALREAIHTLADYTAHVEDMLRQMPAALGSGPIIAFQSDHNALVTQLTKALDSMGGEIFALRVDVKSSLNGPDSLLHGLGARIGSVQNELKNVKEQSNALEYVPENLAGLSHQMNAINAQISQMKGTVGRLERSIIIPIGRGGQD